MSYLKLTTIFLNEHNNPLLSDEESELNTDSQKGRSKLQGQGKE